MMQDSMFMSDGFEVKLSCAHNHPDNKPGEVCKLCGQMPQKEEVKGGSQTTGDEPGG